MSRHKCKFPQKGDKIQRTAGGESDLTARHINSFPVERMAAAPQPSKNKKNCLFCLPYLHGLSIPWISAVRVCHMHVYSSLIPRPATRNFLLLTSICHPFHPEITLFHAVSLSCTVSKRACALSLELTACFDEIGAEAAVARVVKRRLENIWQRAHTLSASETLCFLAYTHTPVSRNNTHETSYIIQDNTVRISKHKPIGQAPRTRPGPCATGIMYIAQCSGTNALPSSRACFGDLQTRISEIMQNWVQNHTLLLLAPHASFGSMAPHFNKQEN